MINHFEQGTWIDSEDIQTDYGQFRRRFVAYLEDLVKPVVGRADIPDTYFSIPATVENSGGIKAAKGYVTIKQGALVFVPYADQTESPKEFRKRIKQESR